MFNKVILQCQKLCKTYKNGNYKVSVLNNISFTIKAGEMVSIIGQSGSGKSTLLHILGGLDRPSSGEVIFDNKILKNISNNDLSRILNNDLSFIYQFHHLLPDFSALENVAMPLLINNYKKKNAEKKAFDLLKIVGLSDILHCKPSEMSGGEKQRVAVARALINKPKLVLADEPTGNLDQQNSNSIFNLISNYNKLHNTTFIVVTHDLFLSKKLNRQMEMKNGDIYNI